MGNIWDGQQWMFKPVPYQIPDAASQRALFVAPFVLDPNNPNRILAGGQLLWRAEDAKRPNTNASGPSWASIKNSSGSNISAIAIPPGNSDIVWVGHDDGQVYKTANGNSAVLTWQQMDNTGANPQCRPLLHEDHDRSRRDQYRLRDVRRLCARQPVEDDRWWSRIGRALALPPSRVRRFELSHFIPTIPISSYLGTEVGAFRKRERGGQLVADQ